MAAMRWALGWLLALPSAADVAGDVLLASGAGDLQDEGAHLGLLQQDAMSLQGGAQAGPASGAGLAVPYKLWSGSLKTGACGADATPLALQGGITCALENGVKTYRFPAGIFEIDEQMLVPESTAIIGAANPNDMSQPTKSPDWAAQTLFLATRGATDYLMNYCHAQDMVTTRVGFVLSSYVTVRNVGYQGIDTIRPEDNGALCGGGAFETKGCAENDCSVSSVNNGGSDGMGSVSVIIENVRLNDYYYSQDKFLVGANIEGNYNCGTTKFRGQCCFCKPNGVRSSQIGIWVPQTRNPEGSQHIYVKNVVSSSTQADGINVHGKLDDVTIQNVYMQNTGDDVYAVWGATLDPTNVIFKDSIAVNPGILRPNWYGTCVATYGLKSVVFDNITCRSPTLESPIPSPGDGVLKIDVSMFVFHADFGASYPPGSTITIRGWTFQDLQGINYLPADGTVGEPVPGKMVWTKSSSGVMAPYYVTNDTPLRVVVAPQ